MAISRRKALRGGVAAMGAAVAAVAGATPALADASADAKLIGLCGQVIAAQDQIDALSVAFSDLDGDEPNANGETYDGLVAGLSDQQEAIVARVCATPCRTLTGERALADCFMSIKSHEFHDRRSMRPDARLALALARAVNGRA